MLVLFQITKKWELALQKEIPQELHEVCYLLLFQLSCYHCAHSQHSGYVCMFEVTQMSCETCRLIETGNEQSVVFICCVMMSAVLLQMLTQQKTACDAMLDEKNKLITDYQAVSAACVHRIVHYELQTYTAWSKQLMAAIGDCQSE